MGRSQLIDFQSTPRRFWLFITIILFAVSLVSTIHVWPNPGMWPLNHDAGSMFLRLDTVVTHYKAGDFFPIWSVDDNHGFGSFQPAMYHKLFYMLAGWVYFLVGSYKAAILATIVLFGTIGALGIVLCMRAISQPSGSRDIVALIAGITFIFANYNFTNWLIRGAMAEYSGAMLVPLLLYYFIESVKIGTVRRGFIVMLGLIFWAHAVLAFFAGMLFAIAWIMTRFSPANIRENFWLYTRHMVVLAVIIGPAYLLIASVGADYDMSRILTRPVRPEFQFKPMLAYFVGPGWPDFTKVYGAFMLNINLVILLSCIVGAFAWAFRSLSPKVKTKVTRPVVALMIVLIFCLVLQSRHSLIFYNTVPGAEYIQFPWRLLAIITPIFYIFAFSILHMVFRSKWRHIMLGSAVSAAIIANSAVAKPIRYDWLSIDKWSDGRTSIYTDMPGYISAEGLPTPYQFSFREEFVPIQYQAAISDIKNIYAQSLEPTGCTVETVPGKNRLVTVYTVTCENAGADVPLPFFSTRLHRINNPENPTQTYRCTPQPDTHFCGVQLNGRSGEYEVKVPTVGQLF
jgi:hypothetical protein